MFNDSLKSCLSDHKYHLQRLRDEVEDLKLKIIELEKHLGIQIKKIPPQNYATYEVVKLEEKK